MRINDYLNKAIVSDMVFGKNPDALSHLKMGGVAGKWGELSGRPNGFNVLFGDGGVRWHDDSSGSVYALLLDDYNVDPYMSSANFTSIWNLLDKP